MAIGRIGGPMLKENLIRQGVDLSFETNLLYLDVNNMRVGVNQAVPTVALEVNGAAKFGNVQVNGNVQATSTIQGTQLISNIAIGTAPFTVTSTTRVANLNVALAGTVTTNAQPNITSVGTLTSLSVDNITINGNQIESTNTNGNITLYPDGTGVVRIASNLEAVNSGYVIKAGSFQSNVAIGTAPFTVTSTTQVANLNVATAGTSSTVTTAAQPNITSVGVLTVLDVDNINISGNTISSTDSNGNIYLDPNGIGRTVVLGTNAITIPNGSTSERPAGVEGDIRVNSATGTFEFYGGGQWVTVTGLSPIVSQSFTGDGSTVNFTLSQNATTNGVLVSINGVVQSPSTSYAVSGTALTFTEAPLTGDVIDVRLLSTAVDATVLSDVNTSVSVNDVSETANVTINGTLIAQVSNVALLPGANITYDLGSDTLRWRDLYLSGSSIKLGSIVLKDNSGTLGVFASDGTTPSTSLATPKVVGGTAVSSALTLQSTSGVGTSDSIVMKVGNNGATTAMTINTSGNTEFRAGTVSLPAITTTGDTNTGIFFPAADTIAFAEGGVEAMRINSSGEVQAIRFISNVAIGTAPFTVTSTTQVANLNVATAGSATTSGTVTTAAQPNITSTGTLTSLAVTGNALIGTSNTPSNKDTSTPKLVVSGSGVAGAMQVVRHTSPGVGGSILELTSTRGTDVNSYTILQADDGVGALIFAGADGNEFVQAASIIGAVDGTPGDNDMPGRLVFSTTADGGSGTTERMRIDSSGRVGIGTTAASSYGRLAVMTPTSTYGFFGIADSVGGGGGVNMAQYYGTAKISYIDSTLENGTLGSETARLTFATSNAGTLTERLRIASAGQIGIGGENYGTSGQVLTSGGSAAAPSWATPNTGVWTVISTQTASASSSIDFTGLSGYSRLRLSAQNITASTGSSGSVLRLSSDNGATYLATSTYINAEVWPTSATATGLVDTTAPYFLLHPSGYGTYTGLAYEFTITNFNIAQRTTLWGWSIKGVSTEPRKAIFLSYQTGSTAMNAIRVLQTAGTITTGTFTLEGIVG